MKRGHIHPILQNDFKRFGLFGLIYGLFLSLFIPIKLFNLIGYSKHIEDINPYAIFRFNSENGIYILGIVIFSIILGVVIFSEAQNYSSNNHLYGLPFTKKEIFINKVLVGIFLILIACLFNVILCYLLLLKTNYYNILKLSILKYYILVFILSTIFFMYSVLFSTMTTNNLLNALFSFTFCVLPYGIVKLLNMLLENILIGRYEQFKETILPHLFPFSIMAGLTLELFKSKDLILFLMSIIFIFILSFALFLYRKNENINRLIVFKFLEPVFVYVVTFITMLIFGIIIINMLPKSFIGVTIGCFIGAFLGHYVSQMVLHREIVVFIYMKGFYVYVLLMIIVIFVLGKTDIVYRHTPPKVEEVEGAYVTIEQHKFKSIERNNFNYLIRNPNTIAQIIELQNYLIGLKQIPYEVNSTFIVYKLKDGSIVKRKYLTDYTIKEEEYLKQISKDKDFKTIEYDILRIKPEHIKDVVVIYKNKTYEIKDNEKINYVCKNLREDILNDRYDLSTFEGTIRITLYPQYYKKYGIDRDNQILDYQISSGNKWIEEVIK
ncbi:ABC transporter permease [Caloramator sp. ALD01]|uniref:ABC transporter permease n=1 Tax=Caloramator sp. ALD01 TaxID=1031288 RepID=UPI000403BE4E|nr:ABC transporter permease [Caloramator sp. ALD01]